MNFYNHYHNCQLVLFNANKGKIHSIKPFVLLDGSRGKFLSVKASRFGVRISKYVTDILLVNPDLDGDDAYLAHVNVETQFAPGQRVHIPLNDSHLVLRRKNDYASITIAEFSSNKERRAALKNKLTA